MWFILFQNTDMRMLVLNYYVQDIKCKTKLLQFTSLFCVVITCTYLCSVAAVSNKNLKSYKSQQFTH